MKYLIALELLLLMTNAAAAGTCTIVTNGSVKIFQHELAHCNGWKHEPFASGKVPPPEYIHDYAGKLTVIIFGWSSEATRRHTQDGAEIIRTLVPPEHVCKVLWNNQGIAFDSAAELGDKLLLGCSVKD